MRSFRVAVVATVLAVVGAVAAVTPAGAAVQGSGTSLVSTTIAELQLGDLLGVRVLGDESRSNLDKLQGDPEAATTLHPLEVSSTVAALNLSLPTVGVRSKGAEDRKNSLGIDLGSLGLAQVVDGDVVAGTLAAAVDAAGAKSGMLTQLTDLALLGGLVGVDSVDTVLGTNALQDYSQSGRGLNVDAVTGLNLGALLEGLGLHLGDLSLDTVTALLDQTGALGAGGPVAALLSSLGLPALPAGGDGADLSGAVTSALTSATDALADLALLPDPCTAAPIPDPLAATLGVPVGTICSTLQAALDDDASDAPDLVEGLLAVLDSTSLLSLDGLTAGLDAKATDDITTSVAKVTAAVGDLHVAGVTVPGVDLLASAQQLASTADGVVSALDDVVGTIDPDLAGLISLQLLDTSGTGVSRQNGYVRSVANLVGATLSINPPDDLAAILAGLPATSITDTLLAAVPGATLAALPNAAAMGAVNTLLAGGGPAVQALADGATLRVAGVSAVATFLPGVSPAAPTPAPTLPRTGGNDGVLALAAALLVALAVGIRRTVLAPVRID